MDDFLIQTSTFWNFEGWGTCLAVQPASRMLLASPWLLPDSGFGLLVLLGPCCFRIPGADWSEVIRFIWYNTHTQLNKKTKKNIMFSIGRGNSGGWEFRQINCERRL